MPQVIISIDSVQCVTTENNILADAIYWISNIRNAPCPPDPKYLDLAVIYGPPDPNYSTSVPQFVEFKKGQTKGLPSPVFDRQCPFDSCVYGTFHLMAHHTPLTDVISAILAALAAIATVMATIVGIGLGGGVVYALLTGAAIATAAATGLAWGVLIALAAAVVAFLTILLLQYIKGQNDDHLGGTTFQIGPLLQPPPQDMTIPHDWNTFGAGELKALDGSGAPLATYASSKGLVTIHDPDYRIKMHVEIKGGHT
jgi:hypothetical protein